MLLSEYAAAASSARTGGSNSVGRAGFEVRRTKGSHHFMSHPDGRRTVVPVHAGETIGPGLLNKILKDADMDAEEFARLL